MSLLDAAKKEFADLLNEEMLSIDVAGELLYFRPVRAMNSILAGKYRELVNEQTTASLTDIVILRARNADGSKMFKPADRDDMLRNLSANTIADIVTRMSAEGIGTDIKDSTGKED